MEVRSTHIERKASPLMMMVSVRVALVQKREMFSFMRNSGLDSVVDFEGLRSYEGLDESYLVGLQVADSEPVFCTSATPTVVINEMLSSRRGLIELP